jgi:hypothetical protein
VQFAILPYSEQQEELYAWFCQYFEKVAENRPNEHFQDIPTVEKKDVFLEYCADLRKFNKERLICSDGTFYHHWSNIWPAYLIQKFCGITSHCNICYLIKKLYHTTSDKYILQQIKDCQALHRAAFGQERGFYIKTRVDVENQDRNDRRNMSFIIDMPQQSGCGVPYLGSKQTFSKPRSQVVVGVKEHGTNLSSINIYTFIRLPSLILLIGESIRFYRTPGNVPKGANLICVVILITLEKYVRRHQVPFNLVVLLRYIYLL